MQMLVEELRNVRDEWCCGVGSLVVAERMLVTFGMPGREIDCPAGRGNRSGRICAWQRCTRLGRREYGKPISVAVISADSIPQ